MRARILAEPVVNGDSGPATVETPFGTVRCRVERAPDTGDWGSAEWTVDAAVQPQPGEGAPAVWEAENQVGFRGIVGDVFDDGVFALRLGTGATVMVECSDPVEPRSTVSFVVPREAVSLTFFTT